MDRDSGQPAGEAKIATIDWPPGPRQLPMWSIVVSMAAGSKVTRQLAFSKVRELGSRQLVPVKSWSPCGATAEGIKVLHVGAKSGTFCGTLDF
jgi:hypothetical protein